MKFALGTSLKNIKRKPFRSFMMVLLVVILSFVLFMGAYIVMGLRNGLSSYQLRLGADIIVTPSSANGHGNVDDILLQGISGNYYISAKDIEKIKNTSGIAEVTTQFFLTSAKASCCSSRVQIIGFDPKTDFSIIPWMREEYSGELGIGEVIVGSNINVPYDRTITFYGQKYYIVGQLAETGTGLDSAVYTNMDTIRRMADDASHLLETDPFKGVNINTAASAVLLRVEEGYEINDVADDINIHITKVKATSSKNMVSRISENLGNVSNVILLLVIGIWILSLVILITVFTMISNERRKEFAIYRIMGASKKILVEIMGCEAFLLCSIGSISGLVIAFFVSMVSTETLKEALALPALAPGFFAILMLMAGTFIVAVGAGLITSLLSAGRITKGETGLLLKGDS